MKREKPCKRKKCPRYREEEYRSCRMCEWNPEAVWIVRRKAEGVWEVRKKV